MCTRSLLAARAPHSIGSSNWERIILRNVLYFILSPSPVHHQNGKIMPAHQQVMESSVSSPCSPGSPPSPCSGLGSSPTAPLQPSTPGDSPSPPTQLDTPASGSGETHHQGDIIFQRLSDLLHEEPSSPGVEHHTVTLVQACIHDDEHSWRAAGRRELSGTEQGAGSSFPSVGSPPARPALLNSQGEFTPSRGLGGLSTASLSSGFPHHLRLNLQANNEPSSPLHGFPPSPDLLLPPSPTTPRGGGGFPPPPPSPMLHPPPRSGYPPRSNSSLADYLGTGGGGFYDSSPPPLVLDSPTLSAAAEALQSQDIWNSAPELASLMQSLWLAHHQSQNMSTTPNSYSSSGCSSNSCSPPTPITPPNDYILPGSPTTRTPSLISLLGASGGNSPPMGPHMGHHGGYHMGSRGPPPHHRGHGGMWHMGVPPPPQPEGAALDRAARTHRAAAQVHEATCSWSGTLPPRHHSSPVYSCKVFLGGIPWDISETVLVAAFEQFGPCLVEWPGREQTAPPASRARGYAYLVFEHETQVRSLLQSCSQDALATGNYYFKISSRRMKAKEVQVIPWVVSEGNFVRHPTLRLDPQKTVFVGALHGMLTAEALARIMNDLFDNVVYAGIDTDKHKYPIGSGRVTFSSSRSYMKAVAAAFIEIRTNKFTKKVQVDPYLEDALCSACGLQQGPYFCREMGCFRYFCRTCWREQHAALQPHHRPLMRISKQAGAAAGNGDLGPRLL